MNINTMMYEVNLIIEEKGITSQMRIYYIEEAVLKLYKRLKRSKGEKEASREVLIKISKILHLPDKQDISVIEQKSFVKNKENRENKRKNWKIKNAKSLARDAGYTDKQGSIYSRGDSLSIEGIDYVGTHESKSPPYFDMGGEGLGLIEVTRKREYQIWDSTYVSTKFLVGRNESGKYFGHAVSPNCNTVLEAITWIWKGLQDKIIYRQGDIALVEGKGPKGLDILPSGHVVDDEMIVHRTHPSIPVPAKGQKVIVGRRAAERATQQKRG